jgi:Tol biopolymer transport system component
MAAGGRLAFSSVEFSSDIWALPLDADRGKPLGPPARITHDVAADSFPTVSDDGQRLVFVSDRGSNLDVWMMKLDSGRAYPLTATPQEETRSLISPDGSRVLFIRNDGGRFPIYTVPSGGGTEEKLCDQCGTPLAWSGDGRRLLLWSGDPVRESTLDLATRKRQDVVSHPKHNIYSGKLSPDDRWIAFSLDDAPGSSPVFIAPVHDGKPTPESEWRTIDNTRGLCRFLWSPDGDLLYYLSKRDGFGCLWAQRLDRKTKQPIRQPFPVHHVHNVRYALNPVGFGTALTKDKLYFSLEERTSNIWLAEPQ